MNKRASRKLDRQQEQPTKPAKNLNDPWISLQSGLIIMAVASVALVAWTTYQAMQNEGVTFWDAFSGSLILGGFLWIIFIGLLLANRYIFRRQKKNGDKS